MVPAGRGNFQRAPPVRLPPDGREIQGGRGWCWWRRWTWLGLGFASLEPVERPREVAGRPDLQTLHQPSFSGIGRRHD